MIAGSVIPESGNVCLGASLLFDVQTVIHFKLQVSELACVF